MSTKSPTNSKSESDKPVPLNGVFSLRTPLDLRLKLEADFARLITAPSGSREAQYAAFDFLVTAEHIPEWLACQTGLDRKEYQRYPEAAITSHIANGAKHFHITSGQHNKSDAIETIASPGAFSSAFAPHAFHTDRLQIVRKDGSAGKQRPSAQRNGRDVFHAPA